MASVPSVPTRLEVLRTLRYGISDVSFATAFATLVSGTFLIGFVQHLGGGDLWIGLISGLPAIAGLLQIVGGAWARSFNGYRRFVLPGGTLWRLFHLPLIALPLLPWPNELRLVILLSSITIASISTQLVGPVYNDWIAELLPANQRGAYVGQRTLASTIVGVLVGLAGGLALDHFESLRLESQGYSILFGAGAVCALISLYFFCQMRDLPRPNPAPANIKETFRSMAFPLRDASFRKILWFVIVFVIGQTLAGGLFVAFGRKILKLDFPLLMLLNVSAAVGTTFTVKFWGVVADRYGNKPIITLLTLVVMLTPVMWIACEPGQPVRNAIILLVGHVFVGIGWNGIGLALLNLFVNSAKDGQRSSYLGMASAIQAVLGGIAPIVGGAMMAIIRTPLGAESGYKAIFGLVALIRALSLIPLAQVHEPGAKSFRKTLAQLRRYSPQGARALRQLSSTATAETRVEAIQTVGSTGFGLATDELASALRDPNPHLRREAAHALARLRDPEAAKALQSLVMENPALVDEDVLEALGECGGAGSAEILEPYLRDPRSALRRTAARALGRLGDPAAIPSLLEASQEVGDSDLRRSALQALRSLGATEAEASIPDALCDPHPSVRTAAGELVSALELRSMAPNLRQSLEWFEAETASEIAYALGAVGEVSDIPQLLSVAANSFSETTRRRALLGVARLLAVEDKTYRIMLSPEFTRISSLETELRSALRRDSALREAMNLYSEGNESKALRRLAKFYPTEALGYLAENPVTETFLIAAFVVASPESGTMKSRAE
ncbi:MAG: MFS transporter [Fimbriimonadaceae bacterium]|nr:MFS transporter [Fimbriimonadaceae bacterium]